MKAEELWIDIITQNRNQLPSYFNEDAVILWPCSNEQFTVAEYVTANCEYPGDWEGEIERLDNQGDRVVLVGHVVSKDHTISCHVVSFLKLEGDKISRMEEYWADDGEAPDWRKEMQIGRPIR